MNCSLTKGWADFNTMASDVSLPTPLKKSALQSRLPNSRVWFFSHLFRLYLGGFFTAFDPVNTSLNQSDPVVDALQAAAIFLDTFGHSINTTRGPKKNNLNFLLETEFLKLEWWALFAKLRGAYLLKMSVEMVSRRNNASTIWWTASSLLKSGWMRGTEYTWPSRQSFWVILHYKG